MGIQFQKYIRKNEVLIHATTERQLFITFRSPLWHAALETPLSKKKKQSPQRSLQKDKIVISQYCIDENQNEPPQESPNPFLLQQTRNSGRLPKQSTPQILCNVRKNEIMNSVQSLLAKSQQRRLNYAESLAVIARLQAIEKQKKLQLDGMTRERTQKRADVRDADGVKLDSLSTNIQNEKQSTRKNEHAEGLNENVTEVYSPDQRGKGACIKPDGTDQVTQCPASNAAAQQQFIEDDIAYDHPQSMKTHQRVILNQKINQPGSAYIEDEEIHTRIAETPDRYMKLDLQSQHLNDNIISDSNSVLSLPHFDIIEREEDDLIELEEPTMTTNPLHQTIPDPSEQIQWFIPGQIAKLKQYSQIQPDADCASNTALDKTKNDKNDRAQNISDNLDEILQEMTSNLYNYLEEDTESSMSCTAQRPVTSYEDNSQVFSDSGNQLDNYQMKIEAGSLNGYLSKQQRILNKLICDKNTLLEQLAHIQGLLQQCKVQSCALRRAYLSDCVQLVKHRARFCLTNLQTIQSKLNQTRQKALQVAQQQSLCTQVQKRSLQASTDSLSKSISIFVKSHDVESISENIETDMRHFLDQYFHQQNKSWTLASSQQLENYDERNPSYSEAKSNEQNERFELFSSTDIAASNSYFSSSSQFIKIFERAASQPKIAKQDSTTRALQHRAMGELFVKCLNMDHTKQDLFNICVSQCIYLSQQQSTKKLVQQVLRNRQAHISDGKIDLQKPEANEKIVEFCAQLDLLSQNCQEDQIADIISYMQSVVR